jgi:hypothetical protein
VHGRHVACEQTGAVELAEDRHDAAGAVHVLHVHVDLAGATLHRHRHLARQRVDVAMVEIDARPHGGGQMCSTVLVEPPIAMSSAMAFSKAAFEAGDVARQHAVVVLLVVALGEVDDQVAGLDEQRLRSAWVASVEPLPGSDRPSASVRQFIELAVNMPEQEPQVGQASARSPAPLVV